MQAILVRWVLVTPAFPFKVPRPCLGSTRGKWQWYPLSQQLQEREQSSPLAIAEASGLSPR